MELTLNAQLLNDAGIPEALYLEKDGEALPITGLNVEQLTEISYRISGISDVASGPGEYSLSIDEKLLSKHSSGISGHGLARIRWTLESSSKTPVATSKPVLPPVFKVAGIVCAPAARSATVVSTTDPLKSIFEMTTSAAFVSRVKVTARDSTEVMPSELEWPRSGLTAKLLMPMVADRFTVQEIFCVPTPSLSITSLKPGKFTVKVYSPSG